MALLQLSTIHDFETLNDEQLYDLISRHRRPNGDIEIPLDGLEASPQQERYIAARLHAAARGTSAHALDVEFLIRRIQEAADNQDAFLSASPTEKTTNDTGDNTRGDKDSESDSNTRIPDPDQDLIDETEAHDRLVKDGGRPLYPIDLLRQVLQSPSEYRDMLRPFWGHPRDGNSDCDVFQRQWQRWADFRLWQLVNRGLQEDGNGYAAHVDETRALYRKLGYVDGLAKLDSNPSCLRESWAARLKKRKWQRQFYRQPGHTSLRDYEAAAKVRLARHGFRQPFSLHEQPRLQSVLTTLIEYLCFECWWYDWYNAQVKRLEPEYDAAWSELCAAAILEPDENAESLRTPASSMRRHRELHDAQTALLAAKLEVERVHNTLNQSAKQIREALGKLRDAKARVDFVERRDALITNFIRNTFDYKKAKNNSANQLILLDWAKIQASPTSNKIGGRKRKRPIEDETPDTMPINKRGASDQALSR
ncbi:hypothetical protein CCM_01954 [Cordyceps militaris CM01]|uniref:Uncharacterized protein n=1 Tax=Cordyceps militaris (strain CM01) TaxID=983644 RepID=G3JBQ9_CORMM|nr:uncharacterized protein CCM_01954 [Cordyceps militaris CM01]EGX93685.1 hypothetical protein CCM_01954 [Cordyceps militaris CM01]